MRVFQTGWDTISHLTNTIMSVMTFFDGDYFETAKMYHYKAIAWRELPKPYKKENQNDR